MVLRSIYIIIQPAHIREERERNEKALETLENAEKRIRRDPEFGKFVRPQAIDNYIKKTQLKPVVVKPKDKKEPPQLKKVTSRDDTPPPIQPPQQPQQQPPAKKLPVDPVTQPKPSNPTNPNPPLVNNQFLTGGGSKPVQPPTGKKDFDFDFPTNTTPPPTNNPKTPPPNVPNTQAGNNPTGGTQGTQGDKKDLLKNLFGTTGFKK